MDEVIQSVISQVDKLKREHEEAKREFLNKTLKYTGIVRSIKSSDTSSTNDFTADCLRKALKEHQTIPVFPQGYVFKKDQLVGQVKQEMEA